MDAEIDIDGLLLWTDVPHVVLHVGVGVLDIPVFFRVDAGFDRNGIDQEHLCDVLLS